MLLDAQSELARALDHGACVLLAVGALGDVEDGRASRQPVVLQRLVYDLDNVARERLEEGVVLATIVERGNNAALEACLNSEFAVELELVHDQGGDGARVGLHVNHAVHAPRHLLLLGLILAALDRVLTAYATADLDDLVGQLEGDAALLLAAKALGESEAARLARHSLRLERILLLHVRVVGEIGAEESLRLGLVAREEIARVEVARALEFRLVLDELHTAPVDHHVHVLELVLGLLGLGLLPHVHDPLLDDQVEVHDGLVLRLVVRVRRVAVRVVGLARQGRIAALVAVVVEIAIL